MRTAKIRVLALRRVILLGLSCCDSYSVVNVFIRCAEKPLNFDHVEHTFLENCTRGTPKHRPTLGTLVSLFMASPDVISVSWWRPGNFANVI